MEIEQRTGQRPIPPSPTFFLNQKQINGIEVLKKFGWELAFIRRPLFSDILPIVKNAQENTVGVLGVDGILKISSELKLRKDTIG